ncbi:hypothetical protein TDB9533_02435 [Thalassocella blandensis]|nr:hypothetical protein TDB9533_02435 [Thalassocella blandensis]
MLKIFPMIACIIFCAACNGDDKKSGDNALMREFVFGIKEDDTGTEEFVAATNDPTVIATLETQLSLPVDQRNLFISGPIAAGDASYNIPWSWHFVQNEWQLAEFAIELCDGIPSFVEADLDYWLDTVGSFCPWASYVKEAL